MSNFTAVLIEHGYAAAEVERGIITSAGGEFIDAEKLSWGEALKLCENAEAIMLRRGEVTAQVIRRFRRCKILLRYGVGVDNIDLRAATEANIIVGHVPDYGMDEVSTHAIALLLACVRRVVSTHRKMENGAWDVHRHEPISRMAGRTLGLVGFGQIGQSVARKMSGWGLRLLASDPFAEAASAAALGVDLVAFDRLCRESDFLSLHCPLLPETHHLINDRALTLTKPGAILINTARGPIVDTPALLEALDSSRLAQAGLDVFEEEPLPADSRLREHSKIICTDHVAWYSEEAQAQLQRSAAEEVVRVCTGGLPRFVANLDVLHRLGRFEQWTVSEIARWQLKRLEWLKANPPRC
jgi:D-3-phosphoglycerate dehydrogenase